MPRSLSEDLTRSILAAVKAGFDAQVATTRQLIALPSLRGDEATTQDFVYRALAERGYTMERFAIDREALARHTGAGTADHSEAPTWSGPTARATKSGAH